MTRAYGTSRARGSSSEEAYYAWNNRNGLCGGLAPQKSAERRPQSPTPARAVARLATPQRIAFRESRGHFVELVGTHGDLWCRDCWRGKSEPEDGQNFHRGLDRVYDGHRGDKGHKNVAMPERWNAALVKIWRYQGPFRGCLERFTTLHSAGLGCTTWADGNQVYWLLPRKPWNSYQQICT